MILLLTHVRKKNEPYFVTFAATLSFDGTAQTRVDVIGETRLPSNCHVRHFRDATHLMNTSVIFLLSLSSESIYWIVEGQNGVKHLPLFEMCRLVKHSVTARVTVCGFKAHTRANTVQIEVIGHQKKWDLKGK